MLVVVLFNFDTDWVLLLLLLILLMLLMLLLSLFDDDEEDDSMRRWRDAKSPYSAAVVDESDNGNRLHLHSFG